MIMTVTLNASIDKAYQMKSAIEYGKVMRVGKCRNSAGGKGLNVARIVRLCKSDVMATGMIGGFNGAYLESLLDEDNVSHSFYHIKGETRSCINILDEAYGSTELLEPGCEVSKEECDDFMQNFFPKIIEKSSIITMSGSVPNGIPKDIYAAMIRIAEAKGHQVILDTSGELLKHGIEAKPTMVKPNKEELEALYQKEISTIDDVIECATKIYKSGIAYVVVSLGGDGALLVCEDGVLQAKPPKLSVVNTVGCGDSMVGAFAVALEKKLSPQETLKYAVAVASANACTKETGSFDPDTSKRILEQVEVVNL